MRRRGRPPDKPPEIPSDDPADERLRRIQAELTAKHAEIAALDAELAREGRCTGEEP